MTNSSPNVPSLAQGRWYIVLAALLWSTGGAFTKALTMPTPLGAYPPELEPFRWHDTAFPVHIACWRALFAGMVLLAAVRPRDIELRPLMFFMAGCFAVMNLTYITAQALGTAANAILLQYSAPLWMYLAAVFLLGERADRRSTIALVLGMLGIAVIVGGGWSEGEMLVMVIGLASGLSYAAVLVCLRALRGLSPSWLTAWNHLIGGLVVVPLIWSLAPPTLLQFVILFFFGAVQMGLAYWLVARGFQAVSPQEGGTILLLEPLLNPVWAYLVAGEVPHATTFVGGGIIVGALAWRYWPRGRVSGE
jgi:drug/metabolite transporter, DME family